MSDANVIITQSGSGADDWTYDSSSYRVSINYDEKTGEASIGEITRNDESADAVAFTNTYTKNSTGGGGGTGGDTGGGTGGGTGSDTGGGSGSGGSGKLVATDDATAPLATAALALAGMALAMVGFAIHARKEAA